MWYCACLKAIDFFLNLSFSVYLNKERFFNVFSKYVVTIAIRSHSHLLAAIV